MKCVNCGTDNILKERTSNSGRCKNCNHVFAFDPQAGSKFTDVFFDRSLKAIAYDNTLFFTRKQLVYSLEKRLRRKSSSNSPGACVIIGIFITVFGRLWIIGIPLSILGAISGSVTQDFSSETRKLYAAIVQLLGFLTVVGSIIYSLTLAGSNQMKFLLFLIGIGVGLFLIYFGQRQRNRSNYRSQKFKIVTPEAVNNWLGRWTGINGSVEKMLPPPREESNNIEVSSDISAYSFDRLLVCESADIAQFLIANNFHFEHNCAVLSITGYPESIFSTVMKMLRRNRDLKVYAFHNASPRGVSLIDRLRTSSNWFVNNEVVIYDLGLLPRHIFSSKNMFALKSSESAAAAQEMPAAVRESLSADEIAWLEAGNYVELESFSPRRLLQVVSRGIANSQSISRGGSWDEDEGGTLASSDDYYLFVSDSFG
ncbi:MAG: hypothetical protein SXA11_05695 [Cyanobacteriota bacterium]|nr:hypothetical protein [Cyanobacteriota bacterium]